jgi:hypothetical protein
MSVGKLMPVQQVIKRRRGLGDAQRSSLQQQQQQQTQQGMILNLPAYSRIPTRHLVLLSL